MINAVPTSRFEALIRTLALSARIRKHDRPGETESERLAHALLDMSTSFSTITDVLLPRIERATNEASVDDVLDEIREEMRHIAYHIGDVEVFRDFADALYDQRMVKGGSNA